MNKTGAKQGISLDRREDPKEGFDCGPGKAKRSPRVGKKFSKRTPGTRCDCPYLAKWGYAVMCEKSQVGKTADNGRGETTKKVDRTRNREGWQDLKEKSERLKTISGSAAHWFLRTAQRGKV